MPRDIAPDGVSASWAIATVQRMIAGLDTSAGVAQIEDEAFTAMKNVAIREGKAVLDTGYTELTTGGIDSKIRAIFEHVTNAGTRDTIAVTNSRMYKLVTNNLWFLLTDGVATTLNGGESGGATNLLVNDSAGFVAGQPVGVVLDTGSEHHTTVDTVPDGTHVTIDDSLPSPAADAKAVTQSLAFSGSDDEQVVITFFPGTEWSVVINGVDPPHFYNSSLIAKIPNLPASGNLVAKTGSIFKDHLILINTIAGGTNEPSKVYWSDTGDPTNWSTGNAGFQELFTTRDELIAAKPLGDNLIIYGTRTITKMEFVGDDILLFNFKQMLHGVSVGSEGIGAASPNSVFIGDGFHLVAGHDSIYIYKGGFSVEKISEKIFKGFFDVTGEIARDKLSKNFLVFMDERDELFYFYTRSGDTFPAAALVFNLRAGLWWPRVFKQEFTTAGTRLSTSATIWSLMVGTWAESTSTWSSMSLQADFPQVLLPGTDSNVYNYDFVTPTEDGTAIDFFITSKSFRSPGMRLRYDWWEFVLSGTSVELTVSTDGGSTFVSLGTMTPGSVQDIIRLYEQKVTQEYQFKLSGSGGGFSLAAWAHRFRQDSRWAA